LSGGRDSDDRSGKELTGAGRVILVGAGPGDPDLISMRGVAALARADVVLRDELANEALLAWVSEGTEIVNVGKHGHEKPVHPQEEIERMLIDYARAGKTVVRLKGGDPFVFGRGAEEASACARAGIAVEVVPGVSSAIGALAYAGIPVTDRRHAASFAVVTGHRDPKSLERRERWGELARAVDTLVILMGMKNLPELVAQLIAEGCPAKTPAAAVMNGTLPDQQVVACALRELPERVAAAGLVSPTVVALGEVVGLREELGWWQKQPLFGMRTLVTRARAQSAELVAALQAAGAQAVSVPLIELRKVEDAEARAAIEDALVQLDRYDALIFGSANAARFFAGALRRRAPDAADWMLPSHLFCVGERTAKTAQQAGLSGALALTGARDAQSLLEEIERTLPPAGRRFLIPGSDRAREVLPRGLRAAGAEVDAVPVYRNERPEVDAGRLRRELVAGRLPLLTFTSPSTVDHFADLLDAASRAAASRAIIAAIGHTTARALDRVGLAADVVPERPGVRELVAALAAHVAALRREIEQDEKSRGG